MTHDWQRVKRKDENVYNGSAVDRPPMARATARHSAEYTMFLGVFGAFTDGVQAVVVRVWRRLVVSLTCQGGRQRG